MGSLFSVHNQLGNDLQEKIYQKAISERLNVLKIPFNREVYMPINDSYGQVGKYYLDFIIDRKIALELKAKPTIYKSDIRQLLAYLAITKLRLDIIANFRTNRLTYRRVINAGLAK